MSTPVTHTPVNQGLAIILAAGEGTRMKSTRPKVLHEVAGLSLVGHAIRSAHLAGFTEIAAVIGPERPDVRAEVTRLSPDARIFEQHERRGTAHAVLQAESVIAAPHAAIVILFGDTPLVRPETITALAKAVTEADCVVAVMGFEAVDPTGYGRLIMEGAHLGAIREHKDANASEREIRAVNGGLMALRGAHALDLLHAVSASNAQNEFYLTDCVAIARQRGFGTRVILVPEEEAQGVNDRVQLSACEHVLQQRLRDQHMRAGVTMIAPETVFLSMDTKIARDVVIEPHCVLGSRVKIHEGSIIHAFSHLDGAEVGQGASVGPYARLRPGAKLGQEAHIGNFVEIKNATIGNGAKANHLAYIGDASVGAGANIGAGTITCNYDGFYKHHTEIGANAFIGTNSSLVAPVKIGDDAYIGSGSVITRDVPAGALAVERAPTTLREGWVEKFRARPKNVKKSQEKKALEK